MMFRRRPFNRSILIGLMFLVAADLVKLLLERQSSVPEGLRDGVIGLLFGLAIGCMLRGVWRMGRADGPPDTPHPPERAICPGWRE